MSDSIAAYIRRTPVLRTQQATLKVESMQVAGSFKARGAFANLLTRPIPAAGVVAASGGNHGAAVAFAARALGVACKIFVPDVSSPAKVARIRSYGAELIIIPGTYGDVLGASIEDARTRNALAVHAFDQVETILGQGTIAKEFEEQAPDLDTILVPVGGGGLLAGVASWYGGRVKIIGVEPDGAPTLTHALAAGQPVDAPDGSVAADSLAARRIGEVVFPLVRDTLAGVVLVGDDDIRGAQAALWENARIIAEPGGATAYAALLSKKYVPDDGERVGVLVSGGNTVISWT